MKDDKDIQEILADDTLPVVPVQPVGEKPERPVKVGDKHWTYKGFQIKEFIYKEPVYDRSGNIQVGHRRYVMMGIFKPNERYYDINYAIEHRIRGNLKWAVERIDNRYSVGDDKGHARTV